MSEYTTTTLVADVRHAHDIQARARDWLHAELTAAGLHPDLRPCAVSPDFEQVDRVWTIVGTRSWCGNAGLSATRSLLVIIHATEVLVFCQSYGGGTTHGTGKGATVAEAIDDLLSKPNVELPRA